LGHPPNQDTGAPAPSAAAPVGSSPGSNESVSAGSKRKRGDTNPGIGTTSGQDGVDGTDESKAPDIVIDPPSSVASTSPSTGNNISNQPPGPVADLPPECSNLISHLTRAVNVVVMKAFEEGLANVRDATKQADQVDRREIRKPRGRVKDSVPTTQVPNNAPRLNGDGVGAGEFGHDGESDSDSDSFPKLRKKQRRATGKRASITNTFHKEIRQFLELHGLFPPKDNPNFTPPSVSEAVLARFRAELASRYKNTYNYGTAAPNLPHTHESFGRGQRAESAGISASASSSRRADHGERRRSPRISASASSSRRDADSGVRRRSSRISASSSRLGQQKESGQKHRNSRRRSNA
ncbi:hypothetical protein SCHPADRAFT_897141, partial [Schizopora paradoxa]